MVLFPDRAIERASMEVIDVSAVGAHDKSIRQTTGSQPVEKRPYVLAVANASEGLVLTTEAVAAVQGDRRQERRLSVRKADRRDGSHTFVERHPSHSK
jgi:hypothetical protein